MTEPNLRPSTCAESISWQEIWPDSRLGLRKKLDVELAAYRDAEQKAGDRLEVPPLAISIAAQKLWGHSLTEERDRRVVAQMKDSSPRSSQALRGHVTRALLSEIEPLIRSLREKARDAQAG